MTEPDTSASPPRPIKLGRFEYHPHARTIAHQNGEIHPTKVADQLDRSTPVSAPTPGWRSRSPMSSARCGAPTCSPCLLSSGCRQH